VGGFFVGGFFVGGFLDGCGPRVCVPSFFLGEQFYVARKLVL